MSYRVFSNTLKSVGWELLDSEQLSFSRHRMPFSRLTVSGKSLGENKRKLVTKKHLIEYIVTPR